MKPLLAIHAWDGGVNLEEERRSDVNMCRVLRYGEGSP